MHTVKNLMGIPPTVRQVTITDMAILHVANGKFVEAWNNADDLGLLQQLGVIPALSGLVFLAGLATGMGLIALLRKVLKPNGQPMQLPLSARHDRANVRE